VCGCTNNSQCQGADPCTVYGCVAGACVQSPGNAGRVCRVATGECDLPEVCNGISAGCPTDLKKPPASDCGGACQACDGNGNCVNISAGFDYQNECRQNWTACNGFCAKLGVGDNCDGTGKCEQLSALIAPGRICSGAGNEIASGCSAGSYCGLSPNYCLDTNVSNTRYSCDGLGVCSNVFPTTCTIQNCLPGTCSPATTSCNTACGDGHLDAGEECDDGNNINGDGCDSTCHLTNCVITQVNVAPSTGCNGVVCTKGNQLRVSVSYAGVDCHLADFVQTDFTTKDRLFQILRSGGNMQGMNANFNIATNPFIFTYTILAITPAGSGKNLTNTTTGLYTQASNALRTESLFVNTTAGIILDECSQYGTITPYPITGSPLYNVIRTQCINYTCANYAATPVQIITTPGLEGVRLWNATRGGWDDHQCGALDGICPDDFNNSGGCGVYGICATHAIYDADCGLQTIMKCGNISAWGTPAGQTCNVTSPTPHLGCVQNTDCVYANEQTGANPTCYAFNSVRTNAQGLNITCEANQTWCPINFAYDLGLKRCIEQYDACDHGPVGNTVNGCGNLYNNQTTYDYANQRTITKYTNNNPINCFQTDPTTGRYVKYCGLVQQWGNYQIYDWLPIYTFYYTNGQRYPENVYPAGTHG